MELQRCEPAGAGLGCPAGIPDRKRTLRERRYRIPQKDLSEITDQLYLVDQPERRGGQQYVRGGVPWVGQYRRIQSQPPVIQRYAIRAGRWNELDGDVCP